MECLIFLCPNHHHRIERICSRYFYRIFFLSGTSRETHNSEHTYDKNCCKYFHFLLCFFFHFSTSPFFFLVTMNYDSKQPISNNIIHKPLFIIIGKLPTLHQCKKVFNDENPQLKNA